MIRVNMSTVAFLTLAAAGCGAGSDQKVTGTVNKASFPEPVTHVRAVGADSTVEAPLAADGSFTLYLPEHDRYRIELVSAVRHSGLVFPRGAGVVDTSFYLEAARDTLALGGIKYIGDIGNASHEGEGTGTGTGDTGTGGGGETGAGGTEDDGGSCGATVHEAEGGNAGDSAVADTNPPEAIGCDGDGGGGGDEGTGGSGDTGTGGSEGGGSGTDPGTGGSESGTGGGGA